MSSEYTDLVSAYIGFGLQLGLMLHCTLYVYAAFKRWLNDSLS